VGRSFARAPASTRGLGGAGWESLGRTRSTGPLTQRRPSAPSRRSSRTRRDMRGAATKVRAFVDVCVWTPGAWTPGVWVWGVGDFYGRGVLCAASHSPPFCVFFGSKDPTPEGRRESTASSSRTTKAPTRLRSSRLLGPQPEEPQRQPSQPTTCPQRSRGSSRTSSPW
jgi:hypothetical protein